MSLPTPEEVAQTIQDAHDETYKMPIGRLYTGRELHVAKAVLAQIQEALDAEAIEAYRRRTLEYQFEQLATALGVLIAPVVDGLERLLVKLNRIGGHR